MSEFKNLPSGWKVVRLGDVFEKITIKNRPDEPILTIKQGVGTILRENSDRQILFDKKQISTYKFVKKNDFIIHLRSFEGGFEMSNHQGIVSPAYIILRNKILISHLYFKNFFRSHLFIHKILAICVVFSPSFLCAIQSEYSAARAFGAASFVRSITSSMRWRIW